MFHLIHHADVGRTAVALADVSPGTLVLEEKPFITYPLKPFAKSSITPAFSKPLYSEISSYVQEQKVDLSPGLEAAIFGYLHWTSRDLDKLYDYYCPEESDAQSSDAQNSDSDSNPTLTAIDNVCRKVRESHPDLFDEHLSRFVRVMYGNAHGVMWRVREKETHLKKRRRRLMYAKKHPDDGQYSYYPQPRDVSRLEPHVALFYWGSKIAHSCSPNLFVKCDSVNHRLLCYAAKPIKQGELLTFSYLSEDKRDLDGILSGSKSRRQAKLQTTKFFKCCCSRCSEDDEDLDDLLMTAAVNSPSEATCSSIRASVGPESWPSQLAVLCWAEEKLQQKWLPSHEKEKLSKIVEETSRLACARLLEISPMSGFLAMLPLIQNLSNFFDQRWIEVATVMAASLEPEYTLHI